MDSNKDNINKDIKDIKEIKHNINFKKILGEAINENKIVYASVLFLIIALITSQIIFPRLYSDFVANIPNSISGFKYTDIMVVLSPYIIAEFLFYISDLIDSNVLSKIELSTVKKLSSEIIKSVKTTKNEMNANELILNYKKIFDVRHIYHLIVSYVVPAIIVSVGIAGFIIKSDSKIGIATIIILIIAFFCMYKMSHKCADFTSFAERNTNIYCDDIHDIFSNIDHVIIAREDEKEINKLGQSGSNLYSKCVNRELCNTNLKFTMSTIYFFVMIIINGLALKLYYDSKISKTILVTIFFMVLSLVQLYDSMIYELQNITRGIGDLNEMSDYFNKFSIDNTILKTNMKISNGDIIFKDVSVNYGNKIIFDNFNLKINGNTKVGIIGEIGSGKSTLIKILVGLIPYDGKILIDGNDTNEYDFNSVLEHIAYIPQNPKLFNRTIYENLSYGTKYTLDDIIKFLKIYELDTFFDRFENKFNTNVGKNGEKLSGGQRQLVYILRTLIQNKKILLLDEPTSALDPDYKNILLKLISNTKNKTMISVTHDKDMFQVFDRVVVLDKGKIIKDI